jgi:hypothetical protein
MARAGLVLSHSKGLEFDPVKSVCRVHCLQIEILASKEDKTLGIGTDSGLQFMG